MTTMIERVALAPGERAELIDDAQYSDGKLYLSPGDIQVAVVDLVTLARAAIEAIRAPTDAMREAGESALSQNGVDYVEPDDSLVCFEAMIDAALNEKATT